MWFIRNAVLRWKAALQSNLAAKTEQEMLLSLKEAQNVIDTMNEPDNVDPRDAFYELFLAMSHEARMESVFAVVDVVRIMVLHAVLYE